MPAPSAEPVSTQRTGPLRGIRVLDFSIALTGPYAAALMADQGADVVKVERPGIGDLGRWVGVSVNGMSALYFTCNRGKRSIALDLHQPEGVEIALRARGGVRRHRRELPPRRDGEARARLRRPCAPCNPDIVYASLTGFGSEGPYRDRSAYDTVIQAYGGFGDQPGRPDRRRHAGVPAPDRGRQGHRALRVAGDHRGVVRARQRGTVASTSSCR